MQTSRWVFSLHLCKDIAVWPKCLETNKEGAMLLKYVYVSTYNFILYNILY